MRPIRALGVSEATRLSLGVYNRRVDGVEAKAAESREAAEGVCSAGPSFVLLLSLLPPLDPRVKECKADDGRLLPAVEVRASDANRSFSTTPPSLGSQLLLVSLLRRPSELLRSDPSSAASRLVISSSKLTVRKCEADAPEWVEASLRTLPIPSKN